MRMETENGSRCNVGLSILCGLVSIRSTGKSPLVKLQSSSSTGMTSPGLDGGMGSPAPTFQNVPLTTGSSNSSDSMDGFRVRA